jgi:hypothetical protein
VETQPGIDPAKLRARIVPKHQCKRCEHQWRGRKATPPRACPMCGAVGWHRPWNEKREEAYRKNKVSTKQYWAKFSPAERRRIVVSRTGKGAAA